MVDTSTTHPPAAYATLVAHMPMRRGLHPGWLMVALTLLFNLCSASATSVAVVLLTPMPHDSGWPIGALAGGVVLRVASFGLVAPFAGRLIRLPGLPRMLTGSAFLMAAGFIVAMTAAGRWQAWLGLGIAMAVAPGMTALALAATIATGWFTARRGLVLGILAAGNAIGQLIVLMPVAGIAATCRWACCPPWP